MEISQATHSQTTCSQRNSFTGAGFLALEISNVYNGGGDSARLGGAAFGGLFFALKK